MDYLKRLRFDSLKQFRISAIMEWKVKDKKGIKKSNYIKEIMKKNDRILKVAEKNSLEKNEVYTDRFPFLSFRKKVW